jgi:exosome complex component RRP45
MMHYRRPDVTVVGGVITVHSIDDRQPVALSLHHIPIATSFAFFDGIIHSFIHDYST